MNRHRSATGWVNNSRPSRKTHTHTLTHTHTHTHTDTLRRDRFTLERAGDRKEKGFELVVCVFKVGGCFTFFSVETLFFCVCVCVCVSACVCVRVHTCRSGAVVPPSSFPGRPVGFKRVSQSFGAWNRGRQQQQHQPSRLEDSVADGGVVSTGIGRPTLPRRRDVMGATETSPSPGRRCHRRSRTPEARNNNNNNNFSGSERRHYRNTTSVRG